MGLIGYQRRLDANREIGRDLLHGLPDILSQGKNVAPFPHSDGKTNGRLSVDPKHRLRRIRIGSVDLRDVAEPDQAAVRDEVNRQDTCFRIERAGHAEEKLFVAGLDRAGRDDHVLRLKRGNQGSPVNSETGELFRRELDKDFFVLSAENFDFQDVRNLQQPRANILNVITEFAMREPLSGKAVDNPVGIAELIVKERTYDAGRQRMTNITNALPHVVPDIWYLPRKGRLFQIDEDRRHTRTGIAANKVQAGRFLKRAFESFG